MKPGPLRIGRFLIDREVVIERPDEARAIMAKVIVLRAELMFHQDAFEYLAISDFFPTLVDPAIEPPRYEWEVVKLEDELGACRGYEARVKP